MKTASTSVETTTAMKSASTVEASSVMEAVSAAESMAAAVESAASKAFMGKSTTTKTVAIPTAAAPTVMIPASAKTATVPARMAPIPAIPRTGTDEHAINEPVRAVVAIRRACIGIIIIISIGADRRWAVVTAIGGAYSHADNHSLRTCKGSAKQANAE